MQGAQKVWQKPGTYTAAEPKRNIPAHPGADHDTDSEEEAERVKEEIKDNSLNEDSENDT